MLPIAPHISFYNWLCLLLLIAPFILLELHVMFTTKVAVLCLVTSKS